MKVPEHHALEFRRALINAQIANIHRCHQAFAIGLSLGIGIGVLVMSLLP